MLSSFSRLPRITAKLAGFALTLSQVCSIPAIAQDADAASAQNGRGTHRHVYSRVYNVPFVGHPNFDWLESFQIRAAINGKQAATYTVDTGSTGIVVGKDEVGPIEKDAPKGKVKYSSSGLELHGVWTNAKVTFPDADGEGMEAIVPVLAVEYEVCTGTGVNADKCVAEAHPHPHMFGIGFGRADKTEVPHPDRNPFLNLTAMIQGRLRRGYVITHRGFQVGLTRCEREHGFMYEKLEPVTVPDATPRMAKDWKTASGSFEVGDIDSGLGEILIDTGLTNMMLAIPGGQTKGAVEPGTPIVIHLLGDRTRYRFNVGDNQNPHEATKVDWVDPTHGVYANTGIRALASYDYLFDAEDGYLGLRSLDCR